MKPYERRAAKPRRLGSDGRRDPRPHAFGLPRGRRAVPLLPATARDRGCGMKVRLRFVRRPLSQRIRSRAISAIAGAMNWNSVAFAPRDIDGQIEWRDRVRWCVEDVLSRLFAIAYRNSDEELRDAEDIPEQYRSERQRRFLAGGAA